MQTAVSDARRYARIRYRLVLIELVGWLGFLLAYQVAGLSAATARWVATLTYAQPLRILGYLAIFGVCSSVVFFPLHLYGGFVLEHRFGLSRLRLTGWLVREAKQVAVSAALGLLLAEGLYALLRAMPRSWPVFASVGWVAFSVVLARVFPTWLLPIFYKTVQLTNESLVHRLLTLCERTRLPALGVFRIDLGVETRKANAALAGFGSTRRVMVSDTLLERFPAEEIETVLGHELGHHRHHHIGKLLVIGGLSSLVAFSVVKASSRLWLAPLGIQGLADIAGFPMLMVWLSFVGLVGLPIQNGLSRHFERQADRFAVAITGKPSAFASALRRLAQLNLADPDPPRWVELIFYDHPPIMKRIKTAEVT